MSKITNAVRKAMIAAKAVLIRTVSTLLLLIEATGMLVAGLGALVVICCQECRDGINGVSSARGKRGTQNVS